MLAPPAFAGAAKSVDRENRQGAAPGLSRLWAAAWSWVVAAALPESAPEADCDHGVTIDPNGGCGTGASAPDNDRGVMIDPDG